MNKRTVKEAVVVIFCVAIAISLYNYYRIENAYLERLFYYDSGHRFPSETRFYPDDKRGYFQFDSQTIFIALKQGKTEVLVPFIPNDTDEPFTPSTGISWTPNEYLQVANALSERVWGESLDLDTWYIRDLFFLGGDCDRNIGRFSNFTIIYYQTIKTGVSSSYTARYISLSPSIGLAEWAGDGNFETLAPFVWKKIEFTKFEISASDAVNIAEENGGKEVRVNTKNNCAVSVSIRENPRRFYAYDWYIEYFYPDKPFSIFINPVTGGIR